MLNLDAEHGAVVNGPFAVEFRGIAALSDGGCSPCQMHIENLSFYFVIRSQIKRRICFN